MNARNVMYALFLFLGVFILAEPVDAQEETSADDVAYARIFTANVPEGLGMSTDELVMIAREEGTEEILAFPLSDYPETKISRFIVHLGSKKLAYPGFTVKTRGHLSRQKAFGLLELDNYGRSAREVMMGGRARLRWTFPDSVHQPLKCVVSIDGRVFPMTIFEILSPSGDRRWPKIVRVDVVQEGKSIIQVFEYLETDPDELQSFAYEHFKDIYNDRASARLSRSENMISKANGFLQSSDTDDVSFAYSFLGLNYDWELDWWPNGSPIQIYILAAIGADLSSDVSGDFKLRRQNSDSGILNPSSASGYISADFGVEFDMKGRLDALGYQFEFDIPYIPNFDLRVADKTNFNSYLLDSSAQISDYITRTTLYGLCFDVVVGAACANADASLSLEGTLSANSISTSGGTYFYNEGQERQVDLNNGAYSSNVSYNENFKLGVEGCIWPDVCVSIVVWEWCLMDYLPTPSLCYDILSGPFGLDYSNAPLDFPESCSSHEYHKCYNDDVYWFDSCGNREEKKEECGSDSCDTWGINYCKNDDLYHSRTCYAKGCSGNSCYSNPYPEEEKVKECGDDGCCDGECCICNSHAYSQCYDNDVYWYDSCSNREEKKDECGSQGCCDGECCICTNGETRLCPNQNGVCSGSEEECAGSSWPGCDYTTLPGYEIAELSCNDILDNDCDGLTDCDDPDCDCICTNGETRLCPNQNGVCAESVEVCTNSSWPGCDYTTLLGYEIAELSCNDILDNDCDELTDCDDPDCEDDPACKGCISHEYSQCYENDVYWFDSCDRREDKREECGNNEYTGDNYCYENDVYRDYVVKGCSGDSCYSNTEKKKQSECSSAGCVNGKCKDVTTTVITTTSITTTIEASNICPLVLIYGEHSEEVELLRYFRDKVLNKTPMGQEIIRLYYQWSPMIVEMIENDREYKGWVKEKLEEILPLIEGTLKQTESL